MDQCLWQEHPGRWGCLAPSWGWLEEHTSYILLEHQVQLRPAESAQPTSSQGGNWKVACRL